MRHPQPFYRKSTKCWYLQLGNKQIKLAESRAESWALYHQIMLNNSAETEPSKDRLTIARLVELYTNNLCTNSAPKTVQWYTRYFSIFLKYSQGLTYAEECRVHHLTSVVDMHKNWKANSRANLARAVKRLFKWATQQGLLEKNPLEHAPAYRTESRDDCVTPEQMAVIEKAVKGPILDLIHLAWDTGMRPQELTTLEARHVNLAEQTVTFPISEAKGKRIRVVYLGTSRSAEILRKLMPLHPDGPLLRSTKGNPWNKMSVKCAFQRIAKATGVKTHLGAFRKGYCTEALKAGLDTVTVSQLMGHTNAVMVSRVYGKVAQDKSWMAEAAKRAKRK